jgi:ADP-ribose pyrophosphatase YjhB (NUDIX family)
MNIDSLKIHEKTPMHTIGAFALIFDEENKVLLCHRTDRDAWNLPGGRVEPHESPWAAVVREVEEEVGLLVRVERLLGVYSVAEKTDLVLNFHCVVVGGAERLSDEADEIRWFDRRSIPCNTLPRQIARIEDAYSLKEGVCLKSQA